MSKDAIDEGAQKKTDDKKGGEPWTDKERNMILNHVLPRILATADFSNAINELPDILTNEGCPTRPVKAYRDQWNRKICKDLLATYGGGSNPPASPAKAASPSKTSDSPSKRKRKEE